MCSDFVDPVVRLETPISLDGILDRCPEFEIRSSDINEFDQEEDTDICQVYPYDKLQPYCLTDTLEVDSDDDDVEVGETISRSFPVFRKQMVNLTEDGKIMKKIERRGCLQGIPDDEGKWLAYVHYAAYVEFAEYPFDVTRLRHKKPYQVRIGNCEVIPGLEMAIKSMKKDEKSKFLIHPDLAYGEKGIPPRIPPAATILFDIELIDICQDPKKYDEEERELPETFEERLNKAKKCRERGNKMKKYEKNVNGAIAAYRRGLVTLLQGSFANEAEEMKARAELLSLYTNLAVCYMAKQQYRKVCIMFNDARHDCPGLADKSVKLLYHSAKALRHLGDFAEALKRLRSASKLQPGQDSVINEMAVIEQLQKKHKVNEKIACKKMFGFYNQAELDAGYDSDSENLENVSIDFMEALKEELTNFKNSEKKTYELAFGCTVAELEFCKRECKKRNLEMRTTRSDVTPKIVIIKREL